MIGLTPTGTVARTCAKANGVDGIVRIAILIGGKSNLRAERDIDDADRTGSGAVALIDDEHLRQRGCKVRPDRADSNANGAGNRLAGWLDW